MDVGARANPFGPSTTGGPVGIAMASSAVASVSAVVAVTVALPWAIPASAPYSSKPLPLLRHPHSPLGREYPSWVALVRQLP